MNGDYEVVNRYSLNEINFKKKKYKKKLEEIEMKYEKYEKASHIFKTKEELRKVLNLSNNYQLNKHLDHLQKLVKREFIQIRVLGENRVNCIPLCTFEIIKLLSDKEIMKLLTNEEMSKAYIDKMLQENINNQIYNEKDPLLKVIYVLLLSNPMILATDKKNYNRWKTKVEKISRKLEKENSSLINQTANKKTLKKYIQNFWGVYNNRSTFDGMQLLKNDDDNIKTKREFTDIGIEFVTIDLLKIIGLHRIQIENEFIASKLSDKSLLDWLLFIVEIESRDNINKEMKYESSEDLIFHFDKDNPIYHYFLYLANNLVEEKCLEEKRNEEKKFHFENELTVGTFIEDTQGEMNPLMDKINLNECHFYNVLCCNYFSLEELETYLDKNNKVLRPYTMNFEISSIINNDSRDFNRIMDNCLKKSFNLNKSSESEKKKAKVILSNGEKYSLFEQSKAKSVLSDESMKQFKVGICKELEIDKETLDSILGEIVQSDLKRLYQKGYKKRKVEIEEKKFKDKIIEEVISSFEKKKKLFSDTIRKLRTEKASAEDIFRVLVDKDILSKEIVNNMKEMKIDLNDVSAYKNYKNNDVNIVYSEKKILVEYYLILYSEMEAKAIYWSKRDSGIRKEIPLFNNMVNTSDFFIQYIAQKISTEFHLIEILKSL